jgi:cell division protein FtsN
MAQQYNPRRTQQVPAKKKKHSGASPNRGRGPLPGWAWLLAGVAVGVFISFLVKLSNMPGPDAPVKAPGKIESSAAKPVAKPAEKPPADAKPATRFDFYTLLPEREVIVPNEREAIQPKAGPGQPPPAATAEKLFLQAGSFRSPQEADRRRAQILLLGLDAKVESVVAASGDTWYRVQAGPFTSHDKLTRARDQLSGQGIETLLLKQKPAG